jgi:hypothetical protein
MGKAVQFDRYGDIDVLEVRDVPRPTPSAGEVLVKVKAAGINPGEAMIRQGFLHDRWPATFPKPVRMLTPSPRATSLSASPINEPARPNSSSCRPGSSPTSRTM